MARRVMDRRALRAEAEAVERLGTDAGAEPQAAGGAEAAGEAKPKPPPKPKKPRTRTAKAPVRMRVVWTVFNNSNHPVAKFDYPKKDEADATAVRLAAEKKIPHFVIAVKEPMETKEE